MTTPNSQDKNATDLKGKKGLRRLINATGYSMKGLSAAYRNEAAFREEVLLACVLIPCALLLGLPAVETVLLIGSVLLLMLVEILNSAIEAVVDRIGPERSACALGVFGRLTKHCRSSCRPSQIY